MARPRHAEFDKKKIVAENRRARFDYAIEETYEAGIALTGTEVKSLRSGEGSIAESYADVQEGEVWLINANIPEFSHGNRFNHEPKRPRKLLLNHREISKMFGAVARQGMTLVPLSVYFNGKGQYQAEKDWKREQGRLLREHR
jgi:SsrA-binding protein